jgi:hypothetical protein
MRRREQTALWERERGVLGSERPEATFMGAVGGRSDSRARTEDLGMGPLRRLIVPHRLVYHAG